MEGAGPTCSTGIDCDLGAGVRGAQVNANDVALPPDPASGPELKPESGA